MITVSTYICTISKYRNVALLVFALFTICRVNVTLIKKKQWTGGQILCYITSWYAPFSRPFILKRRIWPLCIHVYSLHTKSKLSSKWRICGQNWILHFSFSWWQLYIWKRTRTLCTVCLRSLFCHEISHVALRLAWLAMAFRKWNG